MDAGKACARQMSEVIIPAYDTYVFATLAKAATAKGNFKTETADKGNAYDKFLAAQENMGNKNVPDAGRVCLCSYGFANKLKQDPSFMRYGDMTQEMLIKGVMGEVDGVKIVKVPASRLPEGCNFILTHPMACVAPRQLNEYKVHTDPVGISGWLCEGRQLFDAFVLDNKADAIYYSGSKAVEG
jgi:N4-gp56 family major capsid protein